MTAPAQCGRTFTHLPHETDNGDCGGLDGTETTTAAREAAVRVCRDAVAQRPLESAR